jgi:hypothetical protein
MSTTSALLGVKNTEDTENHRGPQRNNQRNRFFKDLSRFLTKWVFHPRGCGGKIAGGSPGMFSGEPPVVMSYGVAPQQGCGENLHTNFSGTPAGVHQLQTPTGGTGQNSRPVPPATIHPHPPGWEETSKAKLRIGSGIITLVPKAVGLPCLGDKAHCRSFMSLNRD